MLSKNRWGFFLSLGCRGEAAPEYALLAAAIAILVSIASNPVADDIKAMLAPLQKTLSPSLAVPACALFGPCGSPG